MSKKQNFVSLSIAKAEYIATGSCCTQLLWMKKLFMTMGFRKIQCVFSMTTPVP